MSKTKYTGKMHIAGDWFVLTEQVEKGIKEVCKGNDGKTLQITVELSDKRTLDANAFYWGILIGGYLRVWPDYDKDSVHRTLGNQFLRERLPQKEIDFLKKLFFEKDPEGAWNSEYEIYIKSTSNMKVREFWEFCEKAVQQLAEIGGELLPHEYDDYVAVQKSFIKKGGVE